MGCCSPAGPSKILHLHQSHLPGLVLRGRCRQCISRGFGIGSGGIAPGLEDSTWGFCSLNGLTGLFHEERVPCVTDVGGTFEKVRDRLRYVAAPARLADYAIFNRFRSRLPGLWPIRIELPLCPRVVARPARVERKGGFVKHLSGWKCCLSGLVEQSNRSGTPSRSEGQHARSTSASIE